MGILIINICFFQLQIDLEPEGRVYVIIDLSGSSGEGKTVGFYHILPFIADL